MFTALAVILILGLVGVILYGFGIMMRRPPTQEELDTEVCSICRQKFPKDDLVERAVGDYRVLMFCKECIRSLAAEADRG